MADNSKAPDLPQNVVDITIVTPLENTDFLFARRYQLKVDFI